MKIDLFDLQCDIKYHFEPGSIGGSHPHGGEEFLTPILTIYSVICKETEIIHLLSEDQLSEIEDILLQEKFIF